MNGRYQIEIRCRIATYGSHDWIIISMLLKTTHDIGNNIEKLKYVHKIVRSRSYTYIYSDVFLSLKSFHSNLI